VRPGPRGPFFVVYQSCSALSLLSLGFPSQRCLCLPSRLQSRPNAPRQSLECWGCISPHVPADVLGQGYLHDLPLLYAGSARWVEASAAPAWLIAMDCHLALFSLQALAPAWSHPDNFLKFKLTAAPARGGVPDCQWRDIGPGESVPFAQGSLLPARPLSSACAGSLAFPSGPALGVWWVAPKRPRQGHRLADLRFLRGCSSRRGVVGVPG